MGVAQRATESMMKMADNWFIARQVVKVSSLDNLSKQKIVSIWEMVNGYVIYHRDDCISQTEDEPCLRNYRYIPQL